jgi:xylulokinase
MGATMVAGLAMRWLRDQVFALEAPDAYDRMSGWAAQAPLGAGGLIFLPYLVGERTPHMNPRARGMFLGLTAGHGRPELVRAVLEGITLACYDAFRVLAELGATPTRIVLAGGGTRSPLWRQIVADVFNLPVQPLATVEQSALGAALLAGSGIGRFDPVAAARAWASYGPTVKPDRARHERYAALFALFQSAYRKHVDDFDALAAIDARG